MKCFLAKGGLSAPLSTLSLSNLSVILSTILAGLFLPVLTLAAQPKPTLLIAAAADLAPLEAPLAAAFRKAGGGPVKFVLGSSGLLARQIAQGAPYDVFLSANEKFVKDLADAGRLVAGTVHVYALGRLGLWSGGGGIRQLEDLRQGRVLHVAIPNPAHAPYGVAAVAALKQQGLWNDVEPKAVYGENVRQALQFAESGNAEAALTAWSLLKGRPGAVLISDGLHSPIRQAGGVIAGAAHAAEARRFIDFLGSSDARRILESFGFSIPK